jgi:hypothetical protein
MSSENPAHNKQRLVVPFRDADSVRRLPKSLQCDHELFDVLSSPLREDSASSDDEWRERRIDNILALLKANAELRALAVKLSEMLAARGGWDGNSRERATKVATLHEGNRRRS